MSWNLYYKLLQREATCNHDLIISRVDFISNYFRVELLITLQIKSEYQMLAKIES